MATGEAAPPPLSIPPPPIEPLSDDDGSSPLSDVEDKDDDPDAMNGLVHTVNNDINQDTSSPLDNLSDANDTEAETERLYDTPQQVTRHKDVNLDQSREERVYERTPSKLRQENTAVGDDREDDGPLSDEDVSMASSPPAQPTEAPEKVQSPTLDILAEAANQEAENRKRKRSPLPQDNTEADQPSPKRTESVPTSSRPNQKDDAVMGDEDDPSSNTHSGDPSADERTVPVTGKEGVEPAQDIQSDHGVESRKQTRSSSRKLKGVVDNAEVGEHAEDGQDTAALEEEAAHTADDEPLEIDVDGEAEAAHRNEEELERKKAAFEQLSGIEKRFATFRDRLYEERLEQLNQEEAMLRSDNPTHPEYLAMMQCIDARRDEKLRIADRELELNLQSLERCAVARRAQIHSQFFQSVRESRETMLAELCKHWYDIQHERRKNANMVPEFGIRFPESETQRIRNALSYNKEVSILSGIAKYEGMPAAPDMRGATIHDLDDDFEAINRNRHPTPRHSLPRPNFAEYGGVPFAEAIGPAGEQFLEQTPWANPNHPSNSHLLQRQHSSQHESNAPSALSATSAAPRRHSHQPNPFAISSGTQPHNGNAKTSKSIPRQLTNSPEVTRAASLLEQTKARSFKAAAEAASKQDSTHSTDGL
ncbi:Sds3-like-domain-containing protein [Xylariaceae sp. FL0016]|nr:Sds3-like-domain-containing protein [Xylariaceae sp. FL0016]